MALAVVLDINRGCEPVFRFIWILESRDGKLYFCLLLSGVTEHCQPSQADPLLQWWIY
jgi:hypothetical protein